jgi:hypothetical protein
LDLKRDYNENGDSKPFYDLQEFLYNKKEHLTKKLKNKL